MGKVLEAAKRLEWDVVPSYSWRTILKIQPEQPWNGLKCIHMLELPCALSVAL